MFAYFPEALRVARGLRGLSREELARAIHKRRQQVDKYETGLQKPRLDTLDALLAALDVSGTGLAALMAAIERLDQEHRALARQGSLFPGSFEVRESETVAKIFYLTDTGILVGVDDAEICQLLTRAVAAIRPAREILLTFTAEGPEIPREPRRSRRPAKLRP